jgi:hypothetical protein
MLNIQFSFDSSHLPILQKEVEWLEATAGQVDAQLDFYRTKKEGLTLEEINQFARAKLKVMDLRSRAMGHRMSMEVIRKMGEGERLGMVNQEVM